MKKIDENSVSVRARINALFDKFPELDKHFRREIFQKVSFRKVTADVLKEKGSGKYLSGNPKDNDSRVARIIFLSQTGTLVGQVGVKNVPETFSPPKILKWLSLRHTIKPAHLEYFEENIQSALDRLDPSEELTYFIVGLYFEKHGQMIQNHLIIGNSSNGHSIRATLSGEQTEAEDIIEQMLS